MEPNNKKIPELIQHLKRLLLVFPVAIVCYVSVALACQIFPSFSSITDSFQKELVGFAIVRAVHLTRDTQKNQTMVSLKILRWIGPQRSDTLITLRHQSYQDTLFEHGGGLGADCSELIGRKTQYLIPIFLKSFWDDTTTILAFPAYHEILGRRFTESDSIRYDETRIKILEYVYINRKAPFQLTITTKDTVYSPSRRMILKLSITNESNMVLPLPPDSGFQVNIRAFKNHAQLFNLYGIKFPYSFGIPTTWPLGHPLDSTIAAGGTVHREIDLLRWYPYLPDTTLAVAADSLSIFLRLNWVYEGSFGYLQTGIASSSNIIAFKADQTTSIPPADSPLSWNLHQNYPNPFNPTTVISYELPVSCWVTLKIFNMLGQVVATLVDNKAEAGMHQAQWNAAGLPSGIYFYRLEAGAFRQTKKLVLPR